MQHEMTFSDLGRVKWGTTLKLSVGRAFFSGVVIAGLFLVMSGGSAGGTSGTSDIVVFSLAIPFFWGLIGPFFSIGMWLFGRIAGFIADLTPGMFGLLIGAIAGVTMLASSLYMCLGDPIVYMLNRSYPALFNVADLGFFNFRPLIFVTEPE